MNDIKMTADHEEPNCGKCDHQTEYSEEKCEECGKCGWCYYEHTVDI